MVIRHEQKNKKWIWLAIDVASKQIVGVYVGARDRKGAKALWESLPPVYRQRAVCYTDFWSSYETVIPKKRHRPVGKESRKTNNIERFNNTLRQRVSRLVRMTLSFSKKLENHIGAIWNFVHHYNASLLAYDYVFFHDRFWPMLLPDAGEVMRCSCCLQWQWHRHAKEASALTVSLVQRGGV